MESLYTTILNTAVPAISSALGVAPLSMKAVLASYPLSLAVFIPVLRQNSARRAILIHVTCYTASLYVIDFTRALNSGEAQAKTYPDSTSVAYTYDNDTRLTQVTDPTGTYQFTFDNM